MKTKEIIDGIKVILENYQKILRNFLHFLIYMLLILATSLLITLPIWYVATNYSNIYTLIVILALLVLSGIYISKNIKTWIISKQKSGISNVKIILIPLKKLSVFTFFILCLYLIIFLYSRGIFLFAIFLSIAYLLILGYFIFIYRKINANNCN